MAHTATFLTGSEGGRYIAMSAEEDFEDEEYEEGEEADEQLGGGEVHYMQAAAESCRKLFVLAFQAELSLRDSSGHWERRQPRAHSNIAA